MKHYYIRIDIGVRDVYGRVGYTIAHNCPHITHKHIPFPTRGKYTNKCEAYNVFKSCDKTDEFILNIIDDLCGKLSAVCQTGEVSVYYFRM